MKFLPGFLPVILTSLINLHMYPVSLTAQGASADAVYDGRIRTVLLHREGWNLSYPVLSLGTTDKLELHFDLLSDEAETYYYSFIHCDRDWKESSVFPSDYIEGMPEDMLENYKPSFNTRIKYYHYSLLFPNDRISLKLSGNYIIKIYRSGESANPVLVKRFMVAEEKVGINADAHRPQLTEYFNTGQQVDFTVNFSSLRVIDPYRDFSSAILKNGTWSYAKSNLKPDFMSGNELKFASLSTNNIFPGGCEYRYFDVRSIRYQSEFIRKIDFVGSAYHVFLIPSEDRQFKPYFYWQDFNGRYYVSVQEGRDMDTDADYVYVYFTLPARNKHEGGDLYVAGALSNWEFSTGNRMTWDPEKSQYQCTMLLKQGWYNYEFVFLKDGEKTAMPSLFEGNHYETENDYLILVYYRSPRDRYDRLVGTKIVNTVKKNPGQPL